MVLRTWTLSQSLEKPLSLGHPWVYRDQVPRSERFATGDWVRIRAGRYTAYAIADADRPLAGRIFSEKGVPDAAWVRERLGDAWSLRAPLREQGDTTAYRVVNGEGDHLPGFVVDLYGEVAVVALDTPAIEPVLPMVVDALSSIVAPEVIALKRRDRAERIEVVKGALPQDLVVTENGLRFTVDLALGQKTGLFLDQRDNRRTVERIAAGRRVLNLFSYTGGFSLYAARGGARAVTSVDVSKGAMLAAERSFQLNGLDPAQHRFEARDVFDFLKDEAASGARYELVVVDPPSFARNQQQMERAERAYVRVNAEAMALLSEGGLLASASCTSRLSPEAFQRCLAEAAGRAGRRLQIVFEAGHALDHPVRPGHPEGRYLKFAVARCLARV